MKSFSILIIIMLSFCLCAYSQHDSIKTNRENAIKIFIQDDYSDMEYIKKELTFVNYVRDRMEADLFILATRQNTGSGGVEHRLYFIGQKTFSTLSDTLVYNTTPDATADELRKKNLQMIKIGLIPYISKTPLIDKIAIIYEEPDSQEEVKDKWDSWVFDISSDLSSNGQEVYKNLYSYSSLDASRITEDWKFEADISYNFNKSEYDMGDTIIVSESKSTWGSMLIVKSLTDHWSAGISAYGNSSTYENIDISYSLKPAIEYNIFPYSESSRKQIRIKYNIGPANFDYTDTTIFNKTHELLWEESIGVAFKTVQKWGSISLSLSGENYLHDFSKNSLYVSSQIGLKLIKGLSFNLYGFYYFIHNQLSLRKEGASAEEILLRQRQVATNFNYYYSVGLTYTFGSIYNNVVNPRFGN